VVVVGVGVEGWCGSRVGWGMGGVGVGGGGGGWIPKLRPMVTVEVDIDLLALNYHSE